MIEAYSKFTKGILITTAFLIRGGFCYSQTTTCQLNTPNLGIDTTICSNAPITLDAGSQPYGSTYTWSNGDTTQTITVHTSGTYSVLVEDTSGTCTKADTIIITVNPSPTANLGGDTTLCNGGPFIATAGNTPSSSSYLWTPGGETTNVKNIYNSGTYSVKVTNSIGCSATDTINVVIAESPTVSGIITTGSFPNFYFSPNYSLNASHYFWDFGDGNTDTAQNTFHTYAISGSWKAYTVCLTVSNNDCGEDDICTIVTTDANSNSTGIKNLNIEELKLFPNPATQSITIENHSSYKIKNITINNFLGQQVMKIAIKSNKQMIDISNLISGLYQVTIEFEEGTVNRKLEVIK
ncbi:MAG TPA: PKD domain-containing protein [Edaphocola sp.]|nr:PKD domain-containing protein [Edaphocola sp.]